MNYYIKEEENTMMYDFKMIVKKTKHNLQVINLPNPKRHRFSEYIYIYKGNADVDAFLKTAIFIRILVFANHINIHVCG